MRECSFLFLRADFFFFFIRLRRFAVFKRAGEPKCCGANQSKSGTRVDNHTNLVNRRQASVKTIMGTKIEYVDSNHLHATNYIRNSKAIAVLWAIFTICYAIISAVAFFTPGE